MELLIGVAGKAGTGKSTLARVLSVAYGAQVTAFADALKAGSFRLFGIEGWFPQKYPIVRQWLQSRGQKGRSQEGNLWLQVWESLYGHENRAIIGDVRYPNEVQFIKAKGGIVIYLEDGNPSEDTHPSENLNPHLCDIIVHGWERGDIHGKALLALGEMFPRLNEPILVLNDNPATFKLDEKDVDFPVEIIHPENGWEDFLGYIPHVDVLALSLGSFMERRVVFEVQAKPFDVIVIEAKDDYVPDFWKQVRYYFHTDILYGKGN